MFAVSRAACLWCDVLFKNKTFFHFFKHYVRLIEGYLRRAFFVSVTKDFQLFYKVKKALKYRLWLYVKV